MGELACEGHLRTYSVNRLCRREPTCLACS